MSQAPSAETIYALNSKLGRTANKFSLGQLIHDAYPTVVGIFATVGGSAAQDIAIPGVLSTDVVNVNMKSNPNSVSLSTVAAGTNLIHVVFSGDPGVSNLNVTITRP